MPVLPQVLLDPRPQDAGPLAVNDKHLVQSRQHRLVQVQAHGAQRFLQVHSAHVALGGYRPAHHTGFRFDGGLFLLRRAANQPQLAEKWTSPPEPYTEATLLRAMETAGKLVDDESLREVMKENGIGRPSTRAAIIETLFKRNYIRKVRKSLEPTPTGIELIGLIHEDLLKSAELTGIWEKKLREIEQHKYEARQFLDELKQMVTEIVTSVMLDNSNRRVSTVVPEAKPKKAAPKKSTTSKAKKTTEGIDSSQRTIPPGNDMPSEQKKPSEGMSFQHKAVGERESMPSDTNPDAIIGQPCPLCGKGHIIKGKTSYGCSEWRNGCGWRKAF